MIKKFLQRLTHKRPSGALILMYHQIDRIACDPWELAVTPENFEAQLKFLKLHSEVVSMQELAAAQKDVRTIDNLVSITFDDGFRDNFMNALPLLTTHHLPATFFITTHAVESGAPYWWDELQQIILLTRELPQELKIDITDEIFQFRFQQDAVLTEKVKREVLQWHYEYPLYNERIDLYFELWQRLRSLTFEVQQDLLKELKAWSGIEHTNAPVAMNLAQLKEASLNPLITIGGHTVHHAMLAAQSEQYQSEEIVTGKKKLEGWIGKQVNEFAYPYGNYDLVTRSLVRDAGFDYAVSTEANKVTKDSDAFSLPRFQVKNWDAAVFADNFNHWLTIKNDG
jgi:peptidoglycan/xylan/chitin deacetylase (PgdA/CDA1 family)